MGKKQETFEALLVRMKSNGPLMMREQLKLLTAPAVEGTGEKVTRNELLAAAHMVSKEATKSASAEIVSGKLFARVLGSRVAPDMGWLCSDAF